MKQRTLVGLGEILWDLLPEGRQMGGAPANFAYHAQAQGARGIAVSAVGLDADGDAILQRLEELGLSRDGIARDPEHPTGTVSVALDASGSPSYTIHEHVAWDYLRATPPMREAAAAADAVCFGSLAQRHAVSRATIRGLLDAAGPDTLKVFDVNIRQAFFSQDVLMQSLEYADVLKISDEELATVAEAVAAPPEPDAFAAHILKEAGLRLVALTRGARGSVLYTRRERVAHAGRPVTVTDAVGAGDSFTAGLVLGLLLERPLSEIAAHANRVAAYVCTQPGATPPIPRELCRF